MSPPPVSPLASPLDPPSVSPQRTTPLALVFVGEQLPRRPVGFSGASSSTRIGAPGMLLCEELKCGICAYCFLNSLPLLLYMSWQHAREVHARSDGSLRKIGWRPTHARMEARATSDGRSRSQSKPRAPFDSSRVADRGARWEEASHHASFGLSRPMHNRGRMRRLTLSVRSIQIDGHVFLTPQHRETSSFLFGEDIQR